jgi:hypothetical protein
MSRLGWVPLPPTPTLRVVLPIFSGILTVAGLWANEQFDASRGPLRPVRADFVGWASLALVGLVLLLWAMAVYRDHLKAEG